MVLPTQLLVGVSLGGDAIDALELTPLDERILDQALWLAAEVGAKVHVTHTIDWIVGDDAGMVARLLAAATERANTVLGEVCAKVQRDGVEITSSVTVGTPWMEMLRLTRTIHADLVVVGPHVRASGLAGLLQGSTVKRLVRKSAVPVWVVSEEGPMGIRRMLTAVDLSAVSSDLVAYSASLAQKVGAEKALLHCLSFPSDIVLHRLPDAADAVAAYHEEVTEDATRKLAELTEGDPSWSVELRSDWVVRSLPQVVRETNADLVVLAGISLPGFAGKIMGTTAEKVLQRLGCSAIVLKPQGWTSPE